MDKGTVNVSKVDTGSVVRVEVNGESDSLHLANECKLYFKEDNMGHYS
jgi:hypothetical protein